MATTEFKQVPIKGMDLDSDELRIPQGKAQFIKNLSPNVNRNTGAAARAGLNKDVLQPLEGCVLLPHNSFPSGVNTCVGTYESKQTNKLYVFAYNDSSNHFIYRINGSDGSIQLVYISNLLNFQLDPKYFLSEGRVVVMLKPYFNKVTGLMDNYTLLLFTDNNSFQRCISVEDSIATLFFNAGSFPYFASVEPNWDPSYLIDLGVQNPTSCISISTIPRTDADKKLQNLVVNKGWRFRLKYVDVFGRESEHGIISDEFISLIGGACFSSSDGLARCLQLNFSAGNPLVDKIQVEYSVCEGNSGLVIWSDWVLYETLDKYNNTNVAWYNRTINSSLTYDAGTNIISYTFCNDRQTQPIDVLETNRTQNPLPLKSSGLNILDSSVMLGNSLRGFEPLDDSTLNKFSFDVQKPSPGDGTTDCTVIPERSITIYGVLLNPWGFKRIQEGNDFHPIAYLPYHPSLSTIGPSSLVVGNPYGWGIQNDTFITNQTLANTGFIGYLAGTSSYALSTQVEYDLATGTETPYATGQAPIYPTTNGKIILLKWVITGIRPGTYIFRVAGHNAKLTDDYQKTSTYLAGQMNISKLINVTPDFYGDYYADASIDREVKEVICNVCSGDLVLGKDTLMTIYDLNCDASFFTVDGIGIFNQLHINNGFVIDGYLIEDQISHLPIEMAPVAPQTTSSDLFYKGVSHTDHNGYFFSGAIAPLLGYGGNPPTFNTPPDEAKLKIVVYDCVQITTLVTPGYFGGFDFPINFQSPYYVYMGMSPYPVAGRRLVKGNVQVCGNQPIGISGVLVVLSHGHYVFTDSNGDFTLVAHNRFYDITGHQAPSDAFYLMLGNDKVILSQSGGCVIANCDDHCNYCFAPIDVPYLDCGVDSVGCTDITFPKRTTCLGILFGGVYVPGINKYGPQTGGKYNLGVTLYDGLGRHTFIQANKNFSVSIPGTIDTQVFEFSKITWAIDGSIALPAWVKFLTFSITNNLNFSDFISWVVDLVDFVDNTGAVNNAAPTQIKIYYRSLSEYNKKNNEATNTTWQFIENTSADVSPVEGDLVEFIENGDGTFFPTTIQGIVKYDKLGIYFLIDYNEALANLTTGALMRITRPRKSDSNNSYFELCPMIPVSNGVPAVLSGTFNYADSYYLQRQIPIPTTVVNTTSGNVTLQDVTQEEDENGQTITTTTVQNATGATTIKTTTDVLHSFPFYFESPSPSDFWGSHCHTEGRVNFINPYERQVRDVMEVAISDKVVNKNNFNGLSYFEEQNIQSFDEQQWGGIVVILVELNMIMVICECDHFISSYKSSNLEVSGSNGVIATSPIGNFSQPERRLNDTFGCHPSDINTIRSLEGTVCFVDRNKGALVISNYTSGKAVESNGFEGYLLNKIATMKVQNAISGNNCYFIAGIDPKTKEYYLTSFLSTTRGPNQYTNTESDVDLNANETICVDILSGEFTNMVSFTPEYYGSLEGFYLQKNLITLKAAESWYHHQGVSNSPAPYNNFYGVQCKKVITLVFNPAPEKVKRFLWNEVYCKAHMFVIDSVLTEAGQASILPAAYWDNRENFWTADFKCDLSTYFDPSTPTQIIANVLLEGNNMYGRWLKARYISQNADDAKYCEVSGIVCYLIASEKSAD